MIIKHLITHIHNMNDCRLGPRRPGKDNERIDKGKKANLFTPTPSPSAPTSRDRQPEFGNNPTIKYTPVWMTGITGNRGSTI